MILQSFLDIITYKNWLEEPVYYQNKPKFIPKAAKLTSC